LRAPPTRTVGVVLLTSEGILNTLHSDRLPGQVMDMRRGGNTTLSLHSQETTPLLLPTHSYGKYQLIKRGRRPCPSPFSRSPSLTRPYRNFRTTHLFSNSVLLILPFLFPFFTRLSGCVLYIMSSSAQIGSLIELGLVV